MMRALVARALACRVEIHLGLPFKLTQADHAQAKTRRGTLVRLLTRAVRMTIAISLAFCEPRP